MSRALKNFTHPGLDRILQWDLRFAIDVVDELSSHVSDPALRVRLETTAREAWSRISPLDDALPRQAAHIDLTDANVVVSRDAGGPRPDGVIDFGDLSHTWAVSELAITASSVLGHVGAHVTSVLPAIRAFHAVRPLSAAEADAVWPLLVLRTAVLIVSGAQQAVLDPDNDYITEQSDAERRMFDVATSIPLDVMSAVIKADLGLALPPAPVNVQAPLVAVDPTAMVTLDLSSTSEVYDDAFDAAGVMSSDVEAESARAALQKGAALVVTRFGEARLQPRAAPQPGRPRRRRHRYQPVAGGRRRYRSAVGRGGRRGRRRADHVVRQRSRADLDWGDRGCARRRARRTTAGAGRCERADRAERARCRGTRRAAVHPVGPGAGMAGLGPRSRPTARSGVAQVADAPDLLARRDESFATVQEFYYRTPPQIERGRRHFLMSTAGRSYLDMVNNVTVLGHAHPRVADTAADSCAGSTPTRASTTRPSSSSASAWPHFCPIRWTRCFWSIPARRQAIWRCGWRPPPPGDVTWSPSARPTTGGRTPPTRCRRRPPTTPMRLPPGRIGCTR